MGTQGCPSPRPSTSSTGASHPVSSDSPFTYQIKCQSLWDSSPAPDLVKLSARPTLARDPLPLGVLLRVCVPHCPQARGQGLCLARSPLCSPRWHVAGLRKYCR